MTVAKGQQHSVGEKPPVMLHTLTLLGRCMVALGIDERSLRHRAGAYCLSGEINRAEIEKVAMCATAAAASVFSFLSNIAAGRTADEWTPTLLALYNGWYGVLSEDEDRLPRSRHLFLRGSGFPLAVSI